MTTSRPRIYTSSGSRHGLWLHIALFAALAALLPSCGDDLLYTTSIDLKPSGWDATDTLVFPLHVTDRPTITDPVVAGCDCRMQVSVRYTAEFPYNDLRLRLFIARLDSCGHASRIVYRQRVSAPIVDDGGDWNDRAWGSLMQSTFDIEPLVLVLPDSGRYQMRVVPDYDTASVPGMVSLGLAIRRR